MGAAPCKCECAGNTDEENVTAPSAPIVKHGQWAEEVTKMEQKSVLASCQAPPTDQNPAVETPSDAAPLVAATNAPLDSSAAKPPPAVVQATPVPEGTPKHCKKLSFKLEPGATLGVRCVEAKAPDNNSTILVINSVADKSPLGSSSDQVGLAPGDVILEVSGQGGASAELLAVIQEARKNGGQLDLVVRSRPDTFWIVLDRIEASLKMGLKLLHHDDAVNQLEVQSVSDGGAVATWNEKNTFNHVCPGDLITAASAVNSDSLVKAPDDIIKTIKDLWSESTSIRLEVNTTKSGAAK